MPYGGVDYARIENMAGLDEVVANERTRATLYPQTVGTVTFPTNPIGTCWYNGTGSPISITPGASQTLDIGMLLTGIIVSQPSAANTSTLDTAANVIKGVNQIGAGAAVGDMISFYITNTSNTGANTITIAAGSGGAFDANQPATARLVANNTSRWIMIRLTNVTAGSEAYVIYM